ncbi:prefoldin subunit 5 [Virgibacillus natechei]|uniref:Prefoldin subunit 5 n=2 Tax=Virgibacillus natechei TaxID=1216297 RepID=A0ABS4II47_9BACI|nr:prefoldin subunit 5 [Virgibacillus natechei]
MSTDLYSINTELKEVKRLVGSYQFQISNKREDLDRLERALTELELTKGDYYETEDECSKPEFTPKTFHGDQAKGLTSLKEEELRPSFALISEEQITKAVEKIREQIKLLQEQIGNLGSSITSLESQQRSLNARKQEVKN